MLAETGDAPTLAPITGPGFLVSGCWIGVVIVPLEPWRQEVRADHTCTVHSSVGSLGGMCVDHGHDYKCSGGFQQTFHLLANRLL